MIKINEFDIKSVETVYQNIKDGVHIEAMYGIVMAIAVCLFAERFIKLYRENTKGGKLDAKGLFDMLWMYIMVAFVCVLIPYLLKFIESLLGDLQSHLVSATPLNQMKFDEKILAIMDEKSELYPESPNITDGIMPMIDYALSYFVSPFIYAATKYLYSFMMIGRYFWLLMLEIVSPIAFVCLMNERTHHFFYTWCKHMILCYLMIPFFILANNFGDAILVTVTQDTISIFYSLVACFLIKLSLFNVVKSKLFNLI